MTKHLKMSRGVAMFVTLLLGLAAWGGLHDDWALLLTALVGAVVLVPLSAANEREKARVLRTILVDKRINEHNERLTELLRKGHEPVETPVDPE